jgi:hypothetical protein
LVWNPSWFHWTTGVIWAQVWEFDHFGDCFYTCALIIWTVLLQLATVVPHQIDCGRRRRCVSSIQGVSRLCFKCFVWMLQKYIWDVAYVAMTIYACCKHMFSSVLGISEFQVFQMYVSSVLSGCCKNRYGYCMYMHVARVRFQVFRMYIVSVLSRCCICFCHGYIRVFQVFQTYLASVFVVSDVSCKCFIWVLQK